MFPPFPPLKQGGCAAGAALIAAPPFRADAAALLLLAADCPDVFLRGCDITLAAIQGFILPGQHLVTVSQGLAQHLINDVLGIKRLDNLLDTGVVEGEMPIEH
jgi:hypothetical protein